jgi:hypothetical protein
VLLKITRFANLSLMGLGTGISFSHFLQWRRKAELPGEVFVRVQKTLYNDYGPTGAIMEPGELLSTLATLALVRKRRIQTVLASVALLTVLAKLPVWALFIRPINEQTLDWDEHSLPPNWEEFPKPLIWRASAESILEKVHRGRVALNQSTKTETHH